MKPIAFFFILILITSISCGCILISGNPFPGTGGQPALVPGQNMTSGLTAMMIAFRDADISTSSPEAKERLKTGLSYLMQYNKPNESLRYFDEALAIDPAFGEAWISKAVAYNNMGQYDDAITCFDQAVETDPDNAAIWRMKGITLQNSGRPDEAAECFRKSEELS
jgi:tetratricopeptide (TPR) repeat protein